MAKQVGHTPGPWSANNWPQGDAEIRIGATGTPRIATVHLRDVSLYEQAANARLIAAVPELLAALRKIAQMRDALNDGDLEAIWAADLARAALAKAEGGAA